MARALALTKRPERSVAQWGFQLKELESALKEEVQDPGFLLLGRPIFAAQLMGLNAEEYERPKIPTFLFQFFAQRIDALLGAAGPPWDVPAELAEPPSSRRRARSRSAPRASRPRPAATRTGASRSRPADASARRTRSSSSRRTTRRS